MRTLTWKSAQPLRVWNISTNTCTKVNIERFCQNALKQLNVLPFAGHDSATIEIRQYVARADSQGQEVVYDEFKSYLNARYVSALEAVWRLMFFPMIDMSHTIIRLAIHLPMQQAVYFRPGQEEEAVARACDKDTTLTAFFKLNALDANAQQFVYHEIPNHYVFADNKWKVRQRGGDSVLARMYNVSPRDAERYFLRLLLLYIKGPTSFEELRTVSGTVFATFFEAAKARGYFTDDKEWSNCLAEAVLTQHPRQIWFLFAIICLHAVELTNAMDLFERFEADLSEDFRREQSDVSAHNSTLQDIEETLRINGKRCVDYGLPVPLAKTIENETAWDPAQEAANGVDHYASLNDQQREIVDAVLADVKMGMGTAFFRQRTRCYRWVTESNVLGATDSCYISFSGKLSFTKQWCIFCVGRGRLHWPLLPPE